MTFGEKLQRLRKTRGWTQEELAQKITVSRQALSKWEQGTARPDTENVLQISKLFGVSTDYLLKDEYESEHAISSVQRNRSDVSSKCTSRIYRILGGMISAAGALGLFVMAFLSLNAIIRYPGTEEQSTVKVGLAALLELYHLGWLLALCIILLLAGVLIAFYPALRSHRTTKK